MNAIGVLFLFFSVEDRRIIRQDETTFDRESAGLDVQFGANSELTARPGGEKQFDAIRAMVTNGPGINSVGQVSGIAGTVRGLVDNRPQGNNGYSVGVYGNATCETNGCVSWGANFSVADRGPTPSKSDVASRTIEGAEIDVNVDGQSSVAEGVNVVGNFTTGAITPTFGYNLQVNGLSPVWAQGYSTGDGAAAAAFVAGAASHAGRNIESQPVTFGFFDNNGKRVSVSLRGGQIGFTDAVIVGGEASLFATNFVSRLARPASSRAPCTPGQFQDDADFHYVCIEPNHWKRVALQNF